jgi:hypothetical protein
LPITFINLVGAREAPDKIIRFRLQTNWLSANTLSKTPVFQSDSEEPDALAENDYADENMVTVRWIKTERQSDKANEPNGDTIHHWIHTLVIDLWGESMAMALLMQDEINRILWTISPNNNTPLLKSDGSSSEADYFTETEILFERIAPNSKIDNRPSFAGTLEINFRKLKT